MTNDHLPQPEDELSDEHLTHVSGGDGNSVRPIMQALTSNEQIDKLNKPDHPAFDAGKNEIAIESIE
jgi:hypothetical protein